MKALNPSITDWSGRRVWLVGASTGIGLACAQQMRQAGAVVIISARKPQGILDWAAQDAGVHWQPLDVTVPADVQATVQRILAQGPLDMVVYAAGHYKAQRATAMDLQQLLQHQSVNVVNPGFVDTPLTAQNEFTMPALISPEQAAQAMLKGWAQGAFDIHFPKRFTLWLKLLRILPYRWYFPLVRRFTGL